MRTKLLALLLLSSSGMWAQPAMPFVDFSVNSMAKAYNPFAPESSNIWIKKEHDCAGELNQSVLKLYDEIPKYSQGNFESLMRGNFRLTNQVISFPESGILRSRFLLEKGGIETMACVSGYNLSRREIQNQDIDFFRHLIRQIRFLIGREGVKHIAGTKSWRYEILQEKVQLEELIADPAKMGVLMSVKGGHCLTSFPMAANAPGADPIFEQMVLKNVDRLKGLRPLEDDTDDYLKYPIFSFCFDGHFDDGMIGRNQSLNEDEIKAYGVQPNIGKGFTSLGQKVVTRLVANEGQRILIDISGMTPDARSWYYEHLRQLRMVGDTLPVIATHSAISGVQNNAAEFTAADTPNKNENSWFNHYQSSLNWQDLREILATGGIVAIPLNKRDLLAGTLFEKEYNKTVAGSAQQREVALKALLANICKIIKAHSKIEAWDIICISSEFDDLHEYFPSYSSAQDLSQLAKDLKAYFENPTDLYGAFTAKEVKAFMYSYTADEIVNKIMSENGRKFMERYFSRTKPKETHTASGNK